MCMNNPPHYVDYDHTIRAALKRRIRARHLKDPHTFVVEEMGLEYGSGRVDIAVINQRMTGYEIKSDGDSLDRLEGQVHMYCDVFDRVVLVVGYRWAYDALQLIPRWWGVTLVSRTDSGRIVFSEARRSQNNPSPNANAIARLLWRDEALQLLEEIGQAIGWRSKPRAMLCERLAETLPLDTLKARVRWQLRQREDWRSDAAPS